VRAIATSDWMLRASSSAIAVPLAKPASASTTGGTPTVFSMARMVAEGRLVARLVVMLVARINWLPSAQTSAWAL
jgi:hypothetical protein